MSSRLRCGANVNGKIKVMRKRRSSKEWIGAKKVILVPYFKPRLLEKGRVHPHRKCYLFLGTNVFVNEIDNSPSNFT